jgi:hypothetical protein
MAIIGIADLKANALPANWVLDEMRRLELQSGATIDEIAAELQTVVQETSLELLRDENYGGMLAVQDSVEVEYHIGDDDDIEELTEHGIPGTSSSDTTGHSIPIRPYGRGLGWTYMGLPKRRRTQIDADIMATVTKIRSHMQRGTLQRAFKMEAEAVGNQAGASVPLADGGVADSSYVPPTSPEGETFLSTHDHYIRVAALNDANVNAHIEHLEEHGYEPPFNIAASKTDAAGWIALTGFKRPEWADLIYHSTPEVRANIMDQQTYVGYYESNRGIARVWLTPRVPTNYYKVFKSFGSGDPRNPVRIRIDPLYGFGYRLVPGVWANSPLHVLVYQADLGWGIGNRTNGVCVFVDASGDYETPAIL